MLYYVNEDFDDSTISPTSTGWNSRRSSTSSINTFDLPKDIPSDLNNFLCNQLSEQETTQLLKLIENWICITHENVLTRNQRLMDALNRLAKQHGQTKRQLRQVHQQMTRNKSDFETKRRLFKQELDQASQERSEAEQLVDDIRREMEGMLEELEWAKQQQSQTDERTQRLEQDLLDLTEPPDQIVLRERQIQIDQLQEQLEDREIKSREWRNTVDKKNAILERRHGLEVAALNSEKEELRQRLVRAEQRSIEMAQLLEAEKRKIKSDVELENALRRSAAEKERELVKVRSEFEKSQLKVEQMKTYYDKQLERELGAHKDDIKERLDREYRQQSDTLQVKITRELREMACQMAELEVQVENAERQQLSNLNALETLRRGNSKSDEATQYKLNHWNTIESELQSTIATLEGRVISLEKEVLVLYSKNLELARQLGELEP
ncbi:unnamed protein product [Rhizopus stolonifer]